MADDLDRDRDIAAEGPRAAQKAVKVEDMPSDGTCRECGCAPANAEGYCRSCVEEKVQPAPVTVDMSKAEALAALSWAKANLKSLSCQVGNHGAEFPMIDRAIRALAGDKPNE